MNNTDAQIKAGYETNNMTPVAIAEDLGFSEIAVKAKLMQISSLYRKACGAEPEEEDDLNFSDDQLRKANDIIYQNAVSAELPDGSIDYRTRQRAAEYIRDDKKGRKEVVKHIAGGNTFNILQFNESMQQARVKAAAVQKQLTTKQTVEV